MLSSHLMLQQFVSLLYCIVINHFTFLIILSIDYGTVIKEKTFVAMFKNYTISSTTLIAFA